MSEAKTDEPEDLKFSGDDIEDGAKDDHFLDAPQILDVHKEKAIHQHLETVNVENTIPSHQDKEEIIKKKYGGLLAKKHPLISKDHERAFFDSADWALNKQGSQKSKGPLEALRPKLEPSPHQHLRARSSYAHLDDTEVNKEINAENFSKGQSSKLESTEAENNTYTVSAEE